MKPAATYFGLVFAAGFLLGAVRTLWLVPRVGARAAELFELPLMLVAVFLSARWVNAHFDADRRRLVTGVVALLFLLVAEVALGMWLRNISLREALLNRDPVSGTAYYLALFVFAVMPWLLDRRR